MITARNLCLMITLINGWVWCAQVETEYPSASLTLNLINETPHPVILKQPNFIEGFRQEIPTEYLNIAPNKNLKIVTYTKHDSNPRWTSQGIKVVTGIDIELPIRFNNDKYVLRIAEYAAKVANNKRIMFYPRIYQLDDRIDIVGTTRPFYTITSEKHVTVDIDFTLKGDNLEQSTITIYVDGNKIL